MDHVFSNFPPVSDKVGLGKEAMPIKVLTQKSTESLFSAHTDKTIRIQTNSVVTHDAPTGAHTVALSGSHHSNDRHTALCCNSLVHFLQIWSKQLGILCSV